MFGPINVRTSSKLDMCIPSIPIWSIWFDVEVSGDLHAAFWMLRCCWNLALHTTMLREVAKSISLISLEVVFAWRLNCPTVGPKIPLLFNHHQLYIICVFNTYTMSKCIIFYDVSSRFYILLVAMFYHKFRNKCMYVRKLHKSFSYVRNLKWVHVRV